MKYVVRDCEDAREIYGIIETDLPAFEVQRKIKEIKDKYPADYSTEDLKEVFNYTAIEDLIDDTVYF